MLKPILSTKENHQFAKGPNPVTNAGDIATETKSVNVISTVKRSQNSSCTLRPQEEMISQKKPKIEPHPASGIRKRENALSVLKEVDGFTISSAANLLDQYTFPKNELYTATSLALYLEQEMKIPAWSEKFKNANVRIKQEILPLEENFLLGEAIGGGGFGEVYEDKSNSGYVIKTFFNNIKTNPEKIAVHECEMFNRYYGDNSAHAFKDKDGNVYLRMYRVPGQSLESLPENSLPSDVIVKLVDLLEKLNKANIMHNDLSAANIMWDSKAETFYPVDISDAKERYFKSDLDKKIEMNEDHTSAWDDILEMIEDKKIIIPSDSSDSD